MGRLFVFYQKIITSWWRIQSKSNDWGQKDGSLAVFFSQVLFVGEKHLQSYLFSRERERNLFDSKTFVDTFLKPVKKDLKDISRNYYICLEDRETFSILKQGSSPTFILQIQDIYHLKTKATLNHCYRRFPPRIGNKNVQNPFRIFSSHVQDNPSTQG